MNPPSEFVCQTCPDIEDFPQKETTIGRNIATNLVPTL
jgi:hypothetical protein